MTWRRINSCPYWDLNSVPSVIQPVANCYTDHPVSAPEGNGNFIEAFVTVVTERLET
jgi:hypothetical protein